jgi:DNA-3-methyladenine glycosylase II
MGPWAAIDAAQAAEPTGRFEIDPQGPFSLAASTRFLERFGPAAYPGAAEGHLHLAFVVDGREDAAGVCLRQDGERVVGEVYGSPEIDLVRRQTARILSLDVDGERFLEVGQRDPVIGRLQARYPGLRPVCFASPYDAAAWTLISARVQIRQAARVKARLAEQLGPTVNIHGEVWHAFPGPLRLSGLEMFRGLFGRKPEWLRALGEAALDGKLDADHLRSLPEAAALAELKRLAGIGDFSAGLILLRGAGHPDALPLLEPRLMQAVQRAYELAAPPTLDALRELAEPWRPYRTWVCVLLRNWLEDDLRPPR